MKPGDELDSDYFCIYLKSPYINNKFIEQSIGSAQKRINLKDLKKYRIVIPEIIEQIKIAKILSTWDKAIETTEKLIENSKAQKKALMQQLLTGKKRFPGFKKEFRRLHIRDIADIDKESLGNKTSPSFKFRYISLSDVDLGEISDVLRGYQYKDAPSRARRVVSDGDILMSTVRPNLKAFAKVGSASGDCVASTGFAVLIPKPEFDGDYLYHYLFSSHIAGQLHALVVGSSYPAINSSDVKGLAVYCPNEKEQKVISSVLNRNERTVHNLGMQLARLRSEKKALMQQLLTGKRRVKLDKR